MTSDRYRWRIVIKPHKALLKQNSRSKNLLYRNGNTLKTAAVAIRIIDHLLQSRSNTIQTPNKSTLLPKSYASLFHFCSASTRAAHDPTLHLMGSQSIR
jgi:hypothetical protein